MFKVYSAMVFGVFVFVYFLAAYIHTYTILFFILSSIIFYPKRLDIVPCVVGYRIEGWHHSRVMLPKDDRFKVRILGHSRKRINALGALGARVRGKK